MRGHNPDLAWSAQTLRMPAWLWLNLAAMAAATLHILLDFGVGLFSLRGQLAPSEAALLMLITLIHVWWVISFATGAQGVTGGIASLAVLAVGWTLLTNGFPIVFCPPACAEAAPLSDVAHIASLVFGTLAPLSALWALWRARTRVGAALPAIALVLVIPTVVAFSNTDI